MTDTLSTAFRPYAPGTQPPLDAPAYGSTHKRHPTQAADPPARWPHPYGDVVPPLLAGALPCRGGDGPPGHA